MDENTIPSADYEAHRALITTWLSRLFLCQIAAVAATALSAIPNSGSILGWLSRIVAIAAIIVLFKLSPAHDRYRKAAFYKAVAVGGGILSLLIDGSILTLAWTVCNLLSQYQEYSAHSDLASEKAPKLSRQWHSLFNWQLIGGVIASVASVFAVLAGVLIGVGAEILTSAVLLGISAVTIILEILYLLCLHKTLALYKN